MEGLTQVQCLKVMSKASIWPPSEIRYQPMISMGKLFCSSSYQTVPGQRLPRYGALQGLTLNLDGRDDCGVLHSKGGDLGV